MWLAPTRTRDPPSRGRAARPPLRGRARAAAGAREACSPITVLGLTALAVFPAYGAIVAASATVPKTRCEVDAEAAAVAGTELTLQQESEPVNTVLSLLALTLNPSGGGASSGPKAAAIVTNVPPSVALQDAVALAGGVSSSVVADAALRVLPEAPRTQSPFARPRLREAQVMQIMSSLTPVERTQFRALFNKIDRCGGRGRRLVTPGDATGCSTLAASRWPRSAAQGGGASRGGAAARSVCGRVAAPRETTAHSCARSPTATPAGAPPAAAPWALSAPSLPTRAQRRLGRDRRAGAASRACDARRARHDSLRALDHPADQRASRRPGRRHQAQL